jgi:hypothetical protein
MKFLIIENQGKLIAETNFWSSDFNANGKVFLSINAGCARLLIPDVLKARLVAEIQTAKYAILSRTPIQPQAGRISLQILFEDDSGNPYSIQLTHESTDRMPSVDDAGRIFSFYAYTRGDPPLKVFESDLYFNVVQSLPWGGRIHPLEFTRLRPDGPLTNGGAS